MSEKNNIENLFRDKFKDFEVAPPEQVWNDIELELSERKKQKPVIPFWIRVSGAAAVLLIGITIATNYSNKIEIQNSTVNVSESKEGISNENQKNTNIKPNNEKSILVENSKSNENEVSKNPDSKVVLQQNAFRVSESGKTKTVTKTSKLDKNTSVSESLNQNSIANHNSESEKNDKVTNKSDNSVANQNVTSTNNSITKEKNNSGVNQNSSISNKLISNKNSIAFSNQNLGSRNKSKYEKSSFTSKKSKDKNLRTLNNDESVVLNQNSNSKSVAVLENQKTVITESINSNPEYSSAKNESNIILRNNNLDSKIVATEVKKDTAKFVSIITPNPLEELLTKKDKKSSNKVAKINRWQVLPNVAPIYFGSASNGSPIDDIFTKNSKNYKPNLSYGLAVNYSVNKRFSVQTGVNKVTLDYNTNDIVFYADIKATNIKTINAKKEAAKMRVENKQANTEESVSTVINQGYLNQKIGYIEIPVEVNYKLVDKKFGINLNAGFSTLVLNENSVSVVSDSNFKMVLGEANNLNKFHVSSNVGVGFNYKFLKSFQINVEPKLKYQINTFSNNDGNFKPYFIGIYSGISYHF